MKPLALCVTVAILSLCPQQGRPEKGCDPWVGSSTAHLVRLDTLPGSGVGYPDTRHGPRVRLAIDEAKDWPVAWSMVFGPSTPPPKVDFGKTLGLIVSSKTWAEGAHGISVDSLVVDRGTLYVVTRERDTCSRTDESTRPVVALTVPFRGYDVRFI